MFTQFNVSHSFIYYIYFHMQSNRQSESYECNYYVMQWMTTIVRATIDRGWNQVNTSIQKTL